MGRESVRLPQQLPDIPRAMLSDFGLATVLGRGQLARSLVGTPLYLSPEQLAFTCLGIGKGYGVASDMWAAGIMLYQLLTGLIPWDTKKQVRPQILECLRQKQPPPLQFPPDVSTTARDLVRKLLVPPHERLSAKQALGHPWFAFGTTKQGGGLRGKAEQAAAGSSSGSGSASIGGRLRL